MDSFTLAVIVGIGIVIALFVVMFVVDRSNAAADRGNSSPR